MRHTGVCLIALLAAASAASAKPYPITETREPCAAYDPLRRPLFGDTHVHTAYSFDASTQDTRNTPRDAYRFARGEALGIQPYDEQGKALRTVRLDRPLDWAAITDHSETLGEVRICTREGAEGYGSLMCRIHRNWPSLAFRLMGWRTLIRKERWGFCGDEGERCRKATASVWQDVQSAAEEAYDRSAACRFTSFVGYEFTGTVGSGQNLHRNVIFRNEKVTPQPLSWLDVASAAELWDRLQQECVDGNPGCDVLTIPHNSNLSGGLMFQSAALAKLEDDGLAITAEEAGRRSRWEPLVEIMQHKGDSECDLRAGSGASDEACGFEKLPYDNFGAKSMRRDPRFVPSEKMFVRWALGEGLRLSQTLGANPFHFGLVAATDTHIATPGLVAERSHPGHGGAGMAQGEGLAAGFPDDFEFNGGGLSVVWAEENARDAIFAAMQRREAYGTSGPRIQLRLFGGWEYGADLCASPDFAARGYAGGVPMGGDLPRRTAGSAEPRFAVSALADPGGEATPLQRVQIVKGWVENGSARERVFDVAGGPNGATVDTATCQRSGAGAAALCSVWSDPDFGAASPAYYYARVLENPTCRWSQYVCRAAKVDCAKPDAVPEALAACCDANLPKTIQERAWSSPIWYAPAG
jgi:Protein of unknown function (DUF3604)